MTVSPPSARYPLHVLSAVAMPAVTATRASADYDWITNCDIGVSSFLPVSARQLVVPRGAALEFPT